MQQHRQFSGPVLRERRERLGYSREVVAVEIGRSAQQVAAYEKGFTPPPPVLRALARALDCEIEYFFLELSEPVTA